MLAALPGSRLVGGCVRDTLAGLPVADIDIATPHPPEDSASKLANAGLRVIPTGLAHGTVTAISCGQPFEITTLRRDVETDGRHASVAWTDSFEQDAARRDFTINAMSVDAGGALHDYFGGVEDLAARRVRFVGNAAARVTEDYLRILRFFRFFARYADGPPDAQAEAAIRQGLDGLARISAERVWSECKRILQAPDPSGAIASMTELGVLARVLPEAADHTRLARLLRSGAPNDPILRLAALLQGDPGGLADRLKLSTAERDLLTAYLGLALRLPASDTDLRRALADTPAPIVAGRLWLTAAPPDAIQSLATLAPAPFPLEGRHALALGAAPGPAIGQALRQVRAWWLEGGCTADEPSCLTRLALALQRAAP